LLSYCRLIEAFKAYGAKAAQVSLGQQHTVLLTDDGEVLCCGVGEYGRQGTGHSVDSLVPTSVESLADEEIVQIAAGQDHTLALTASGAIFSWGRNQSGQLGHSDSYIDIYSMEDFPRLIDAESINNGENEEALLRDGMKTEHNPLFKQVAAGSSRSAALTTDGLMYIWGARVGHQPKLIGKGLFNGMKVIKVACGGDLGKSAFAAITEDNSLWMVGDASSKLLGVPGLTGRQPVPVLVTSLANKVVDVSCGFGQHMAAFVKMTEADH
jgi:alpha-tubulin suppressor-like RCC1 family protein